MYLTYTPFSLIILSVMPFESFVHSSAPSVFCLHFAVCQSRGAGNVTHSLNFFGWQAVKLFDIWSSMFCCLSERLENR